MNRSGRRRGPALTVGLCLIAGAVVEGQSMPSPQLVQRHIDEVAAYGSLIRMMARIDDHTRAPGASDGGMGLRTAVATKIGLSTDEFAAFADLCREAEARIKPLDARADEIIGAVRAKYKNSGAGRVPPPPPELLALQQQKDAIVGDTMRALQDRLSASARTKIGDYLASLLGQGQVIRSK